MLEFCGRKFICDECPICKGIEHRLNAASEGGYKPQLEYCGCDKVQTEFFIGGYCSDAFETVLKTYSNRKVRRYKGDIHNGNSYRRHFDYAWELD